MELNDSQKQEVARWFAAGASLDEIQKRLNAEFGVHLTYLDVRLLVAELPQPVEPEPPAPEPAPVTESAEEAMPAEAPVPDAEDPPPPEEAPVAGAVKVEMDALTIPGTLASGDVTFGDGQKGKWYLDQMGRLGLGGDLPQGYRPSPADAAAFQSNLMQLLRAKGMM